MMHMTLVFWQREKERPRLSGIYDLTILNEVLKDKGLGTIIEGRIGGEKPSIEAIP